MRLPRMRCFRLDAVSLVLMEVSLLIDEIYAEEVVDQGELLLVAQATELAVHFVVFAEVDFQEAGFVEGFCLVFVHIRSRVLFQSLNVGFLVLEKLFLA